MRQRQFKQMITPKKNFKDNPTLAKGWQSIMDSGQFQQGCQAALFEMEIRNANAPDMASAASRQWRTDGALQFLSILMGLTATDTATKAAPVGNLKHDLR